MHHFGRVPIMLLVFGGLMAFRIFRMSQRGGLRATRGLRLDQIWIMPAILLVAVVVLFAHAPPRREALVWVALAAAIGAAVGWWRGGLVRIAIDPRTRQLTQQTSPAALIFIVALFVVRFGLRFFVLGTMARNAAMLVTECLAMFVLAMFTLQRVEMFLRAKRLMAGRMAQVRARP